MLQQLPKMFQFIQFIQYPLLNENMNQSAAQDSNKIGYTGMLSILQGI